MARVPSAQHPLIAREGRTALVMTVVTGITLYAIFGIETALPAVLVFIALCVFFRDPHRESPSHPLAVVAPVDGRVSFAAAARDPWLGRDAMRVTLVSGLLDVHSMFGPVEGKIVEQWSEPRFPDAADTSFRRAVAYLLRTDEGDEVTLEIARSMFGGPLRFNYQPGERIGHGRRVGYATLGCRVTVYMALASNLETATGEQLIGAESVLGSLVHDTPVSAIRDADDAEA